MLHFNIEYSLTLINTLVDREVVGLLPASRGGVLVLHHIPHNLLTAVIPRLRPGKGDGRFIDVDNADMARGIGLSCNTLI